MGKLGEGYMVGFFCLFFIFATALKSKYFIMKISNRGTMYRSRDDLGHGQDCELAPVHISVGKTQPLFLSMLTLFLLPL